MKALVVIPSYNTGHRLVETVRAALHHWPTVWVVVDGSSDGSDIALERALCPHAGLHVLRLTRNHGKGAAVLAALRRAHAEGFTHACTLDSDGQHRAADIPVMMAAAARAPGSFVLGVPIFGPDAPTERVRGRRVGNTFAKIETLFAGPEDSLYGFRVYPVAALLQCMRSRLWGRRYDFDTEAAVRLVWMGLRPLNMPTPVRYYTAGEGGVSHFNYLRDNVLLTLMHTRLLLCMLPRIPRLLRQRRQWKAMEATPEAACTEEVVVLEAPLR